MKSLAVYLPAIAVGFLASQVLSGAPLLAAMPFAEIPLKNLTANGSIQAYCREVRINTIVVPEFCSLIARAEQLYSRGDVQGAVLSYDRALEIKPQFALAYYNRGICRYQLGDKQGGIQDVARAQELLLAQGDKANYDSTVSLLKLMQAS